MIYMIYGMGKRGSTMEINGDLQTVSMQMQYGAGTSKMSSEVSTSKSSDETNISNTSKASNLAAYSKTKSMANTKYTAVSKDGDTLELSSSAISSAKAASSSTSSVVSSETSSSSDTISDTELATYTESKLRQLLSSNQITRQQYEKAISGK